MCNKDRGFYATMWKQVTLRLGIIRHVAWRTCRISSCCSQETASKTNKIILWDIMVTPSVARDKEYSPAENPSDHAWSHGLSLHCCIWRLPTCTLERATPPKSTAQFMVIACGASQLSSWLHADRTQLSGTPSTRRCHDFSICLSGSSTAWSTPLPGWTLRRETSARMSWSAGSSKTDEASTQRA